MITIPSLQTALLDLLHEVQGTEVKLIIGDGYGIYLKNNHVRRMGMGTLLQEWPEPRSTNDLDLFLRPELLINSAIDFHILNFTRPEGGGCIVIRRRPITL